MGFCVHSWTEGEETQGVQEGTNKNPSIKILNLADHKISRALITLFDLIVFGKFIKGLINIKKKYYMVLKCQINLPGVIIMIFIVVVLSNFQIILV